MKSKSKIFSIKTFIILAFIAFVGVLIAAAIINGIEKMKFEEKKQQAMANPLKVYENGYNSELSNFVKACEWEVEEIDSIVLGIDADGNGISKYYIDDLEVVEEILTALNDVQFYGITEAGWKKMEECIWTVQLIQGDERYSLELEGYNSDYEGVEISKVDTCYADYPSSKHASFPSVREDGEWYNILYGENVYDKLLDIYNENVCEITKERLIELKTEQSRESKEFFRYMHSKISSQQIIDEDGELTTTITYKFSIKDSECYMKVERYNVHSSAPEDTHLNIRKIEIFNSSGDSIDFYECKDEELEDFLN